MSASSAGQRRFARIDRLPPYVFNITAERKLAARRAGVDVIDMSMGNPDGATPPHIVAKLVEAAQRPDTHGYSASKGIPRLRRAICHWYEERYGVQFDAELIAHGLRIREVRSSRTVFLAIVFLPVLHEQALHLIALLQ